MPGHLSSTAGMLSGVDDFRLVERIKKYFWARLKTSSKTRLTVDDAVDGVARKKSCVASSEGGNGIDCPAMHV